MLRGDQDGVVGLGGGVLQARPDVVRRQVGVVLKDLGFGCAGGEQ